MSQAGRAVGSEGGETYPTLDHFAPSGAHPTSGGEGGARGQTTLHSNIQDIENAPESEPDASQPDNASESGSGSESESESEEEDDEDEVMVMVTQTKTARRRYNLRQDTTITNRILAAPSYYYGTRGTPPSNNGEGCPVVPGENRGGDGENGGGKRRKVAGGDGRDKKFACQVEGCNYRSAWKQALKKHMANKHDVGVVWHHCGVNGCKYKSKRSGSLKLHKMHVHDIDVIWHHCDVGDCDYITKNNSDLKKHKKRKHK